MFGARGLPALLNLGFIGPPHSVREWCRFFRKVSRLPSKSDCFHLVSFHIPCNVQFRCRGVSIISFACVMTGSGTLKNSQTAAEGLQYCVSVACRCCPVSFDILCNPQFRCRGVSIISFACVMTGSSTLKKLANGCRGASILYPGVSVCRNETVFVVVAHTSI